MRKELGGFVELLGVVGEGFEIVVPRLVVRELGLHVVVVETRAREHDHLRGGGWDALRGELSKDSYQLHPSTGSLCGRLASLLQNGERSSAREEFCRLKPEILGGL